MRNPMTEPGLLLGWNLDQPHSSAAGFRPASKRVPGQPITYEGEGHLCTIARTGAGKGTGLIIPNLLRVPNSVICIDPKGENARITANYRRSIGQSVHIIDPFGKTGLQTDTLDPLDMLLLPTTDPESDVEYLAAAMIEIESKEGAFWDRNARHLLAGEILFASLDAAHEQSTLADVWTTLMDHDVSMTLARRADAGVNLYTNRAYSAFLSYAERVRDDTLAVLRSQIAFLTSSRIRNAVSKTTIPIDNLINGTPTTIYLVIPPEHLNTQAPLLRLWLSLLIRAILERKTLPQHPTLFMLDEVAQLGSLPLLKQALTLLRGYGLQCWMFWQDLSQMRELYPRDWQTILNNCQVFQAFGFPNHLMSSQVADFLGTLSPDKLLALPDDQLVMVKAGGKADIYRRPNYLYDPIFSDRYQPDPVLRPHGR